MNLGVIATANDDLDQETAILLVEEMGHKAIPLDQRTMEDVLQDPEEEYLIKFKDLCGYN
jgi:hypothetical protein